ncbi:MAG TPA: SDR family NAD(P)-dependent oxidoreductase [Dongiaceae bacterium]|jgi:NAD(P)-dependent dehydrogenase (short-subunit alcohol dehydrogenase family)|nr:SDR family NAD(P)-dependent oxidoreductase [Dongiaceae bacterium]
MHQQALAPAALFDVEGMTAVITGGGAGIGLAYAKAMADNGARVVLLDADASALESALADLTAAGADASGITVDVTDSRALRAAIDEAAAPFRRLDVVFANAGITAGPGFLTTAGERNPEGAIESIAPALWHKVIATNLTSVFATIRASVPHMKRRESGSIIVTTSIAGLRPSAVVGTPYMIAKAAAAHLVRQAAVELARYGIRVNSIAPGPFLTRITSPGLQSIWERALPVGRVATTDEMQGLALFLASGASSYVTGAQLVIDGGSTLGRAA